MYTTEVVVKVQHQFAIGDEIITKSFPPSTWRVTGIDFEKKYGGRYILAAVDEPARLWMITQYPKLPAEQAAQQTAPQYVSYVDMQFVKT